MVPQSNRLDIALSYLLPLLAVGLSLISLTLVLSERSINRVTIEGNEIDEDGYNILLDRSAQTLERAEDALGSVELVLSFLEGASVLAGIIVLALGVVGVASLKDLRADTEQIKQEILDRLEKAERELTERVERAENQFAERAQQLSDLEQQLEVTFKNSQDMIDKQINLANQAAKRSFEALSYHIMGQRLAREHNINAAVQACRTAYELDPANVPNNYLLGTLYIRKNKLDEAIFYLTEALKYSDETPETAAPTQAALGLATRKKGDATDNRLERNRLYNQAETYLIQATTNDELLLNDDGESYFGMLGSLYRRQERVQDAILAYEQAAEATPRRSYPEINLAMLYFEKEDNETGERHRRAAEQKALRRVEDSPDDYWALHDLALAFLLDGQDEKAIRKFEEALEITPDMMTVESVTSRLNYAKDLPQPPAGVDKALELLAIHRQKMLTQD